MKYPLFKVNMPKDVHLALQATLESGFVSEGPKAKEFEQQFQVWLGNPYTALVNSGTMALTLAYRMAGIGPGKECIASPMTCLASTEPILSLGGKVVWCDIDPSTGNIDPGKIEKLITKNTVAISFTDWSGTPCELDAINKIAIQHGLKTIEDAAHSLGARYNRRKVGTLADYTCFSFQAVKHMTTVDGGALACLNQEDYDRAVLLRWFGCARGHNASPVKWTGDVVEHGYKGHMSDVNATIGLESLKTISDTLERHRLNGNRLRELLEFMPGVELLKIPDYIESSFWIFTIKLKDAEHRQLVSQRLDAEGVGNNIVHTRNDSYSLFKGIRSPLPGMDDFGERMLNIPCGWWLSLHDIWEIAELVSKATDV